MINLKIKQIVYYEGKQVAGESIIKNRESETKKELKEVGDYRSQFSHVTKKVLERNLKAAGQKDTLINKPLKAGAKDDTGKVKKFDTDIRKTPIKEIHSKETRKIREEGDVSKAKGAKKLDFEKIKGGIKEFNVRAKYKAYLNHLTYLI